MNVQAGQMRRMVDDLVSLVSGVVNDRGIILIEKEILTGLFGGLDKTTCYALKSGEAFRVTGRKGRRVSEAAI